MTSYVALLRGINVNGITITMSSLQTMFGELGFTEVKTVLASGNVLFTAEEGNDAEAVKARIETALSETYGYQAWIVLLDLRTLARIVDAYPYDWTREGWHPYVLFSSDDAAIDELLAVSHELDPHDERVSAGDAVIYWEVRRAVGIGSSFSRLSGKSRYRSSTTTRNLRTLHKLLR